MPNPLPAFPQPGDVFTGGEGMTLRQYFAGRALPGVMAELGMTSSWKDEPERRKNIQRAARVSYEVADAMLEESGISPTLDDRAAMELAKGIQGILETLNPKDLGESFWRARNVAIHLLDRARELGLLKNSPNAPDGPSSAEGPTATGASLPEGGPKQT